MQYKENNSTREVVTFDTTTKQFDLNGSYLKGAGNGASVNEYIHLIGCKWKAGFDAFTIHHSIFKSILMRIQSRL